MADKKKGGAPAQTPKGAPQQRGDSARGPRRDNRGGYNSIQIDPAITGLKPVPRPNREQFDAEINSHNQTIDKLKKEITETTNKINDLNKQKGDLFQQKDKLFNQLKELKAAKTQSKENRKKYIDEIKALGEQKQKMREELQKLKEKIPPKLRGDSKEFKLKDVLDKIDLKITELENRLKLTSMPLSEEKTVVAKISSLHNAKKLAREYDQEMQKVKGTLDSNNRPAQDKRERLNELIQHEDKTVAELKGRQDVLQKELDTVREKITKITDTLPILLKKREDLRAQVGTEQAAKAEIFKKRDEAQKVYGEYMEKVREIKKEEWNKQKVVIAAEREKRKVEHLQQQLTAVQFEEELHTCDVLVAHLQQYLIKPEEDEEASEQAASSPAANTPEGAVVLKRDVSEDVADAYKGGKRKQKAQKPKTPVLKADSVLKHSLTLLQQFESLSLACPLKVADVPKSIEEIKQKKEHFILLGIEKKKQLEAEWVAKQKEAEAKAEAEANATTTEDADADANPEAQS